MAQIIKNKEAKRGYKTANMKLSVKHAVLSVYLIDELIKSEEDSRRLEMLKKLRKEAIKVWQQ